MTWNREKMGKYSNSARYLVTGLCLFLLTMVSTGIAQPGNALAEDGYGPGTDRFKFNLGAFFPAISTELQVDVGNDVIDMEEVFGLSDNETVWRLDGYWRFFPRHRLAFGYYRLNREASTYLSGDIEIGDKIWPAEALIASDVTMDFYQLSYLYSFFQGEKWEIAGSIGAYWVRLETSLALAAEFTPEEGEPIEVGGLYESDTFEGPLPLLGLQFDYYITPKWMVSLHGGYFQLTFNDYKGNITNLGAKLEYQFTEMFGLGLGYDAFRLSVEAENAVGFAQIEFKYQGVQVYGILRF